MNTTTIAVDMAKSVFKVAVARFCDAPKGPYYGGSPINRQTITCRIQIFACFLDRLPCPSYCPIRGVRHPGLRVHSADE